MPKAEKRYEYSIAHRAFFDTSTGGQVSYTDIVDMLNELDGVRKRLNSFFAKETSVFTPKPRNEAL